jgi:hypothetical protein
LAANLVILNFNGGLVRAAGRHARILFMAAIKVAPRGGQLGLAMLVSLSLVLVLLLCSFATYGN